MKPLAQKMKSLLWVVLVGLLAALPFQSKAQQAEVSFQVFYDELAPHGEWLQHPRYGDVWSPNVEGEFTPYLTNGYWTVSQYGNTWVSNYDWGWATFHYGRWFFDDMYGWVWIPDNTWAPAWVVWRNGGGYYGWAPMSPGLNFSVSLNIYSGIPSFYWNFVPQQYVWRPYAYRYCAPRHRNVYIMNNTTYVTHYHGNTYNYFSGPSHTEIRYITRRPVVINQIEHCDRPGRAQFDRDKIVMYRPVITRKDNDRPKLTSVPRDNNGLHKGWDKGNGPISGGNNGNGQGNNGHGNGDQDAPGNSGGNNNGENSDNSGNGNSGNGKGKSGKGNSNNGGRSELSDTNGSSTYKKSTYRSEPQRTENRTTPVRNYSPGNSNKSTNSGSSMNSGRGQSSGNRQITSGSSGGNTRSYTPSRTTSTNRSQSSYSPNKSTPTRSQSVSPSGGGSKGNSNVSPSRSGGGQRSTPSNSGGSKSSGSGSKKRN